MKILRASSALQRDLPSVVGLVALVLLSGCATSTSFDRHNLSRLWVSNDGKEMFFDASVNAQYPRDSEAAEATRKQWIEEWLKLRNRCGEGYAILERRDIGRDEVNPHRHNLRYKLTCS